MSPSLDYSSAQHGMDPDDVPFEGPVQTEEKLNVRTHVCRPGCLLIILSFN